MTAVQQPHTFVANAAASGTSGKDRAISGVWAGMSPWVSDRFLSSQSDERLVALACTGSERAFAAIVQRYRRPLLAFARRLAPTGEAEDLVQQTFMSALAALQSGIEVRHLRGWLHQILRHAAMHAAKRTAVAASLEHADAIAPSAQQAAELKMLAAEALLALSQLPARQHDALLATAVHGRSRAEVAGLLGLSEGAVRQLVHRARQALRTAVTAITPYPLAQALAASPAGSGVGDVVGGIGAGSVVVKVGALIASGVVATGIVASGVHSHSHSAHRSHRHSPAATVAPLGPSVRGGVTRVAELSGAGSGAAVNDRRGDASGRTRRDGAESAAPGVDGGPGGGDGSPGGPSPTSGSSDGGGVDSGSSGGPSATTSTTASSSDGGSGSSGGGGSGSSDGGKTMTTILTTTTTTSGSDGGSSGSGGTDGGSSDSGTSGGSGSGDTTTTTTTSSGH